MAPQPKPPGQRRRRNAGQAQWKQLPADGRQGRVPPLPSKRPGWRKSTREWWKQIWRSPMATAWEEADLDGLVRLARLRDDFERGVLPVSAYSQITALEDRFGLSPKARRNLQWEVAKGEVIDMPKQQPKDRRLRAVDG